MSATMKLTVRVTPSSKKQRLQTSSTGSWGGVSVNGATLNLPGQTLVVPTDSVQYWTTILNQVIAALNAE